MKNIYLILSFLLLLQVNVFSQNAVTLRGVVSDSSTGIGIEYATVQLLSMPDSTLVSGVVTQKDGSFSLPFSKAGSYCVVASYIGYNSFSKNIYYRSLPENDIQLGNLKLSFDAIMLDEAVVTAEAPPVKMEEDTVVYNASAYKVTEGAVLEELIEKLPGAEVADDGKIKINGRELKKIMVDGKEFFGGDLKTGLQNLPVELIDQLKTYSKESDMERMTGIDDGDDEVVLDIKFKKGKNKGWFGNLDVAGGTEERYSSKVMLNRFVEDTQHSIIGTANNVDDRNFSNSSRANWKQNNGLISSYNAGYNMAVKNEKLEIGGSVQWRGNDKDIRGINSTERFYSSKSTFSNANNINNSVSGNLKTDWRVEWKPDKLTTILFRPSFTYSYDNNKQNNISGSFNQNPEAVVENPADHIYPGDDVELETVLRDIRINSSMVDNSSMTNKLNGSASLMINRKIGDNGRNIGFRLGTGINDSDNGRFRDSETTYYRLKDMYGNDSVAYRRQYISTETESRNYSAQITYSEPIAQSAFLQFSYQFLYKKSFSGKSTYDFMHYDGWSLEQELPQGYEAFMIDSLGKDADYKYFNHDISMTVRVIRKKYKLSVGITMQPQKSVLSYRLGEAFMDTTRQVFNFAPKIDFKYRFSKVSQLQFKYYGKSSQPGMEAMLPIEDNSNPLNIRVGNPGLLPSFSHNIRLGMNTYNNEYQRSVIINANASIVQNSISNSTMYNEETGGRITMPKNINGNWNGNLTAGFNTALRNKKFTIHANTSFRYRNSVGYIYESSSKSTMKNTLSETGITGRLSGVFRNELMELSANSSIGYTFEKNKLYPDNNQEPYTYSYGCSATFNLPWSISIMSGIVNQCRRGYDDDYFNRDELLWNARLSKSFYKGRAILSIEAYDMLAQKSNISRSLNSNVRSITEYNGVNSYVMAHFIYRYNVMGGKKKK